MIAYCYRSGHVGIARTLPAGAIELATWDNEAELITACRWRFPLVEDAEGCPAMACTMLVRLLADSEIPSLCGVAAVRKQLNATLLDLREHPSRYQIGSNKPWSSDAIMMMQEASA